MRTPFTEMILDMEEKGARLDEILPRISGKKVSSAYQTGDFTNAIITAGQTVGLIHNVPTLKEIIDRMIKEAERVTQRLGKIKRG